MSFDLVALRAALAQWPSVDLPDAPCPDNLLDRIRQVLIELRAERPRAVGFFDVLPLLRHALLREGRRSGGSAGLLVPSNGGWPETDIWRAHGFQALARADDRLHIDAVPWTPDWLDAPPVGVFADALAERPMRREAPCLADPFFADATGFGQYHCPGQREAIRAAFLMPPGNTLIVNLPTGSGKSLVGQAPAMVHGADGHLTLFVVPTVALALDQERQMRRLLAQKGQRLEHPLAWYGDLGDEQKRDIRRRIRAGTQRILFTSPEALVASLLPAVFDATQAGMLRYLVIDEAHLVTQWGDEFRPAFQALAGLRKGLLRRTGGCPFRTLLLSATLTSETIEGLARLFGPEDHVELISAVHLRPEPQYWFHRAVDSFTKELRVLEAIRHAPRPFVLYVTKREEATRWRRILGEKAGLRRIGCFHGNTPNVEREQLIEAWAENRLDGMVATSAFGVGIDKGDVRTIIHATVPETLDRFYQEVGRGGRDGKASASLLIYEDQDWQLPEALAVPTLISDELGLSRWRELYNHRTIMSNSNLIELDLDTVPPHNRSSSDYNADWNMRTLLLMARAQLLELDLEPPLPQSDEQKSPLEYLRRITVRLLHDGHLLSESWEQEIAASRARTLSTARRNLEAMRSLLRGGREMSRALADLYAVHASRWAVDITRVCGGCPEDRPAIDVDKPFYRLPKAVPVQRVVLSDFAPWRQHFPSLDPACAHVFWQEESAGDRIADDIRRFIEWLVAECGVQEVVLGGAVSGAKTLDRVYTRSVTGVVVHRSMSDSVNDEPYSPLARVTVLAGAEAGCDFRALQAICRPHHIMLLPAGMPDPDKPERRLIDVLPNAAHLEQLLAVISR